MVHYFRAEVSSQLARRLLLLVRLHDKFYRMLRITSLFDGARGAVELHVREGNTRRTTPCFCFAEGIDLTCGD